MQDDEAEVTGESEDATEPNASQEQPEGEPQKEEPKAEPLSELQQKVFNEALGSKVQRAREAEEKAEQLTRELAEARSQIPQAVKPVVPPLPDAYSDTFAEEMAARDTAMVESAKYEAIQTANARQAEAQQQQLYADQQTALKATVTAFSDRGSKIGIDAIALDTAANVLAAGGLAGQVGHHILNHEQGPAITMYLARNPVEVDNLARMAPMDAAARIATEIAAKAKASAVDAPPDPVETEKGGGAALEYGPKGAVYE